jgi:hypothetical protein
MKARHVFPFVLLGLFLVHAVIWHHCPLSGVDGPASWSHAYSILVGNFGFDAFFNSPPRFITGYLAVPFFSIFRSAEAPFYFMLIWQLLSVLLLFTIAKKDSWNKNKLWGILLLLSTNPLFWVQRQEIIALPFILLFYLYSSEMKVSKLRGKNPWIEALLFILCLGIHPLAGITCAAIFLGLHFRNKQRVRFVAYATISLLVLLSIMFRPQLHYYWNHFQLRLMHYDFVKSLMGFLFTVPVFYLVLQHKQTRGFILPLTLVLLILAMTYYWIYAILLLLFVPMEVFQWKRWVPGIAFLMVFSLINPVYQQIENLSYGSAVQEIILTNKATGKDSKIFVESAISIPLIYDANSRLLVKKGNQYILHDEFRSADTAYTMQNPENTEPFTKLDNVQIETLVKPVKGLRTLKSFYTSRTDSIGLWKIYLP